MHLPRGREAHTVSLVKNVLTDMCNHLNCTLVQVSTHNVPAAMRDLGSDQVLCVEHDRLNPIHLKALRWGAHHRHRPVAQVKKQLECDVFELDESRIEKGWKAKHRARKKSARVPLG